MGPAATYAFITFGTGLICLLGWLYVNADNPRCGALLKKSLLLFALPIAIWPSSLFGFPLGMWVSIAFEEGLKAFASTRERSRVDKFWLVVLFGIWELTLDKPFWGFVLAQGTESWDRISIGALVYGTALHVLMHAVTAAVYAFAFKRHLWAAFLASWFIHTAFNEAVSYFSASPMVVITETLVLAALLLVLTSDRMRRARVESS